MEGSRPRVSVVVVTHNNERIVGDCLRAIEAAVPADDSELIVVDNASADGTLREVERAAPAARTFPLAENVGFARAVNHGLSESAGHHVALVNSDAFPDPGSIERLLERLEASEHIGIVGAALRYPDGALQPAAGTFPSLLGGLWVALFLHRVPWLSRLGIGYLADASLYRSARRVDWVCGALCVARADVGPLPDTSFMYGEDVGWAWRCREGGLEVWLEPAATGVHIGRASVDASRSAGFAQRSRVTFELAWFAPRGRFVVLLARGVLVLHALTRIALVALVRARGRAGEHGAHHGADLREYGTLLAAALRTPARS
jgi:GT2 family glycosyltransferase